MLAMCTTRPHDALQVISPPRGEGNVCAGAGEGKGDPLPDAVAGARDQGHPALKPEPIEHVHGAQDTAWLTLVDSEIMEPSTTRGYLAVVPLVRSKSWRIVFQSCTPRSTASLE